ncbi:mRNA-degrading endonuclease RelE of RelBE toxin-antitoxin system [Brevibacillus aydinogluensis]|jgi:mRNA-degrading endonuclease RelE of RelBE toxin-antitoxin system|nr:mRNA-degrading endonuclease RelE of RelBE toxin-antitoxin system [Brevibacillus aydinogluensis]
MVVQWLLEISIPFGFLILCFILIYLFLNNSLVMKYRIKLSRKLDREIAHLKRRHDEITKREVEIVKSNNPEFADELEQLVKERIKIEYLLKTKYESVINRR